MNVTRINFDNISEPQLPSITQSTLDTIYENCVRCLNSDFMVNEDKAINILEFAARVCYKSDTKKTDALRLIKHLYEREHFSVFEHINYSFILSPEFYDLLLNILNEMKRVDRFSVERIVTSEKNTHEDLLITCNLRSFFELYQYSHFSSCKEKELIRGIIWTMSQVWPNLYNISVTENLYSTIGSLPLNDKIKTNISDMIKDRNTRYVFHIICSRAVANQLTRHRTLSFSQESTRFVSYNRNENEDICIFISDSMKENSDYINITSQNADICMKNYLNALAVKIKPENARDNLPLNLKTELVMSGNYNLNVPQFLYGEFAKLINVRISSAAQPDTSEIVKKIANFILKSQKDVR